MKRHPPRVHSLPSDDELLPAQILWPLVRCAPALSARDRCEELASLYEEHGLRLELIEHTRVFAEIDDALAQTGLFKSLNQPDKPSKSPLEDILSASVIQGLDGWCVQVNVSEKTIYVGWALIERLWAYSFAYQGLFEMTYQALFDEASPTLGTVAQQRAAVILEWTRECERLKQQLPWPDCLPRPNPMSPLYDQQSALRLFVRAMAWILLHEIGHVACRHSPTEKSPRHYRSQELQADDWASRWLVGGRRRFRGREDEFGMCATGIVLALSLISSVEIYNEQRVSEWYPDSAKRLHRFLLQFVPNPASKTSILARFPWFAATVVLETQLSFVGVTNLSRTDDITSYFADLCQTLDLAADKAKQVRDKVSSSTSRRSPSPRRSKKGRKS